MSPRSRRRGGGEQDQPPAEMAALWECARPLAEDPCLLDRLNETLARHGLAGEDDNARLLYLAATARLLPSP